MSDPYRWKAVLPGGVIFDGTGRGEPTARRLGKILYINVMGPGLSRPFRIDIPGGAVPSMFYRGEVRLSGDPAPETFFCGWQVLEEGHEDCTLFEFGREQIYVHKER